MTATDPTERLREQVIELTVRMENIMREVVKLEEANEGTMRSRGMKERILIAEENIERNKQSFEKVETKLDAMNLNFNRTVQEAFIETKVEFARAKAQLDKRIDYLITDSQTQKGVLAKWLPYLQVIGWLVTAASAIILSQFLGGHWHYTP